MYDEEKELRIKKLLEESRSNGVNEITPLIVFKGMRFILSHEYDDYEDFARGLIELGCNFNLEEVREYMQNNDCIEDDIQSGLYHGDIVAGASIICNVRDSEYCKDFAFDKIIYRDDDRSPVVVFMKKMRMKYDLQ